MARDTLEVDGLDDLEKWLAKLPTLTIAVMRSAMTRAVMILQSRVAQYPPATAANRPGRFTVVGRGTPRVREVPMGYYERGRGYWYPITRAASLPETLGKGSGAMRVKNRGRVVGYKLAGGGRSELLGKSYVTSVTESDGLLLGSLGNDTTYLDFVQGRRQTRQHARTGWQQISRIVESSADDIMAEFEAGLDQLARDFSHE